MSQFFSAAVDVLTKKNIKCVYWSKTGKKIKKKYFLISSDAII